ncbi:DUF4834 family protein [Maribacter sp. 2-571]|uniref:DUF4834 family protein n=1 Tax=Maribacter sp. 2-571 TaxID=3417569 RepID=UPI003D34C83D
MGFLKAVLIILLVYYLFKIVVRMFAPKILGYAAKKTEQHFREKFEGFQDVRQQQEGEVTITTKSDRKHDSSEKVGEYIDFEEVD